MAEKTVFESSRMDSTHYGAPNKSATYTSDIENGTFGYLDGLTEGETEVYNFVPGYKEGEPVVVIDNPPWDPDECRKINQRRDLYVNKAGSVFKVRTVAKDDKFAINKPGVTTATADNLDVGAYLTIDSATGKLVAGVSTTTDAGFEAVVESKRTMGGTITTSAYNYGHSTVMYKAKVTKLS